jgi:spore coat polysaccharide biosynthesis protein SpsF
MNITAIIQARMGSKRLPKKTLMEISGKPMLGHVVERLRCSHSITGIVVATSVNHADTPIVHYARQERVTCFAGSEDDVLSRFVGAAKSVQTDLIVRITGDCPLIDPGVLDEMIAYHLAQGVEYTGNLARRTLPRGLDAEVFSVDALFKADRLGLEHHHREHVTPFIYEHPELFTVASFEVTGALRRPDLRLCVDTQEDMDLIQRIYQEFYRAGQIVDMRAVIAWLDANPEWKYFNQAAELEHIKRNQLDGVHQLFLEPVTVPG